jgi:hypothetical protein
MAIKKTIEIDVSTVQAVGGLDNLSKALEKVDASAKGVDATFEEVYGDLKPLTARMGEAEDRLYELALAGQSASQEYKDLLASVGQYRQVQMKTDMAVDAAATTLDSKLGGALQGATSAFAGIQGAMALTGGQSEELEAAILKVQGAMALAEGVRGLREGSVAFKALGTSAKAALNGIKTGIAATGIGVLVIALGAIVAYWDDIKEAVNGVSSEQENLNKKVAANVTAEQQKFDTLSLQENALKLQGKSEKDILKMKMAQTDQMIKASEIQIEQSIATSKAQTDAAKRNQEILAGVLKYMSVPLTLLLKTVDAVGAALGKDFGLEDKFFTSVSKFVFDPKKTQEEGDAVVAEQKRALEKLKSDKAGLQLSINNIDKQASKDAADKRKEANDKAIQAEKDKADALERIRQGEIDTEAERRAEEIRQVQEQYKALIAEAEKYYGKNSEKVLSLKEAQLTKEKELKDKFKEEDRVKEEEYWIAESEKAIARDEEAKKKRDADAAEEIEFQKAKDEAIASSKQNLNNIISGIEETGLAKTKAGQAVSKAIALTQIGIDSAVAISKASTLANAEGTAAQLAFPTVPGIGTAARIISYASTALSVVSNIARAKKLLSSGGSSTGGSSGGGGGASAPTGGGAPAPSFNVVGNSGVNQIAQTLGAQQPVQAYVVASNVTTQQSLDRNIVANASLG